jgi:hypothetical protein
MHEPVPRPNDAVCPNFNLGAIYLIGNSYLCFFPGHCLIQLETARNQIKSGTALAGEAIFEPGIMKKD